MDMVKSLKHTIDNENGFVLGASILVSAILVLAGVLAIWTSNTEVQNCSQRRPDDPGVL